MRIPGLCPRGFLLCFDHAEVPVRQRRWSDVSDVHEFSLLACSVWSYIELYIEPYRALGPRGPRAYRALHPTRLIDYILVYTSIY